MLNQNSSFIETPVKNIVYKNFNNIWIKDESVNPTGTHKDRMAWHIAKIFTSYFNPIRSRDILPPPCSLISAGNAAIAIASLFKKLEFYPLKVLLDKTIDPKIVNFLKESYCEVYITDVYEKSLKAHDILLLTNNLEGIDITSYTLIDQTTKFYGELVNHVLSLKPDTIIIPYGSGGLFENFCLIIKENFNNNKCNLIGVSTRNKKSKANKLYSAFSPFDYNNERLHFLKRCGFIGNQSGIYYIEDNHLEEAMNIFREYKIKAEYSGVVGLAYIIENANKLNQNANYIIVNTGQGILDVQCKSKDLI